MNQKFFAPIRAVFALFLFLTFSAFAAPPTDPIKTDHGIGKKENFVSIASAEELGSFVRQNALTLSFSSETNTIRYEAPAYFLNGNELSTSVATTYNLSTGNVQEIFIVTKYRTGTQTMLIFPYEQEKTNVSEGPATAPWILMELNRINALSKPNKFIQTNGQQAQPEELSGASTPVSKPQKTARSGSKTNQR